MPFSLCMPKLSPTMTEGTIAKWHKAEGTHIDAGELILEVATDKATIEHHMPDPGWLKKILVQEGGKAVVGQPLAILTVNEQESISGYTPESVSVVEEKPTTPSFTAPRTPTTETRALPSEESKRIPASPLARTIAAQEKISLSGIRGTGPGGRIMSRDLESLQKKPVVQQQLFIPPAGAVLTELTPMRQTIGKRLQYSQSTIPHFYVSSTIDATELVRFREALKAQGKTLTINDFILKATAKALMDHPALRCSLFDTKLLQHEHADISLAVSIPNGLVTPVIKNAETKALQDLSVEAKTLADKARAGKLLPHEYEGGSFTLTNLGMFGVQAFMAIINPPQVAILAVGSATDGPVIKNGTVLVGKNLTLTVSADHRAVDGSDAAAFLKQMKELLNKPSEL